MPLSGIARVAPAVALLIVGLTLTVQGQGQGGSYSNEEREGRALTDVRDGNNKYVPAQGSGK